MSKLRQAIRDLAETPTEIAYDQKEILYDIATVPGYHAVWWFGVGQELPLHRHEG